MPRNRVPSPSKIQPKEKNTGFPTPEKKGIIPAAIPSPAKVFTSNSKGRAPSLMWEAPEWDLALCGRIIDTEAYVRRAFRVKKNLFTKEGWEFTGPNPERVAYVRRRLQQMEIATGEPFPILLAKTINSLVSLQNAFWVKVRNPAASGGKVRVTPEGKTLNPVAGYFLFPASTVRFKRDENGKIYKYAQVIFGKEIKEFNPEDVIHFCFDKREGFAVAPPILVPVEDDIRALRRIEENVELLVYQHLFPLFHYQVGTPESPAAVFPDGTTEVEVVRAAVARMPSDGCWVTPERHTVKAISADSGVPAIDKVLDHFKKRIFTGLGVSSVDMGESGTANRSTAQTLSRNLIDDTKADQKEFGAQFYSFVIRELLLESTFSQVTILDDENQVYLKFKEIDSATRIAVENHYTDLFLKNMLTHDEARIAMGYEPFIGDGWPTANSKAKMFTKGDGDFARTSYGLIDRDKIILQSIDEPGTDASQAESKSRTTAATTKAAGGSAVSAKSQPTNQHGTRPGPKLNKDSYRRPGRIAALSGIYGQSPPLRSALSRTRANVLSTVRMKGFSIAEVNLLIGTSLTDAKDRLVSMCQHAFRIGIQEMGRFPYETKIEDINFRIQRHVERYSKKLIEDLSKRINANTRKDATSHNEDLISIGLVFDAFMHRAEMIDDSEIMRSYNYGRASGYRLDGFGKLISKCSSVDCPICSGHYLSCAEGSAIIYEELPPWHPHCECRVTVD